MQQIAQDILEIQHGAILHAVSVSGKMDGGFSRQLGGKHPLVRQAYNSFFEEYQGDPIDLLGGILEVPLLDKLWVVNLFCISERGSGQNIVEYSALKTCLQNVNEVFAHPSTEGGGIYVPYKMGAGGNSADWSVTSRLIHKFLPDAVVCILPQKSVEQSKKKA